VDFCGKFDLEAGQPGEEILSNYFKFLRLEKKISSSLWTGLLLFEQYFQEEVQREAAGAAEIDPSH
jgi:hypothetical protein